MASFLKKVSRGLGKALQVAAPVLAMTGVGAPLAIGLGAAGGAMQGGKPKQWLKRAAIGGGAAGLGALAKGSGALGKAGGWLSKAGGMAGKAAGAMGGAGPPGAGGGGALRSLADLAPVALGAYGAYQGNQDMNRARELDDRMLGMAEQDYASRAPMRQQAMQMMQQQMQGGPPQQPAPSMFRGSNPFQNR